jgi:hypothetical protein
MHWLNVTARTNAIKNGERSRANLMQPDFRAIVQSEYGLPKKVFRIVRRQLDGEELFPANLDCDEFGFADRQTSISNVFNEKSFPRGFDAAPFCFALAVF